MAFEVITAPIKVVGKDFLLEIIYFPVWWYTRGMKKAFLFCLNKIKNGENWLGLGIWVRNILVPMFGQYDLAGRLISFAVRLVQIIARTIAMVIWVILMITLFFIWLLLPILAVYKIISVFYAR
jgi:hypothetical protein